MNTAPFEESVFSRFGAPMGRKSDNPINFFGRVHLQRVPMIDGAYDPGGAYWGGGRGVEPLFCAWQDQDIDCDACVYYFRAPSREAAKEVLRGLVTDKISFYR